MKNKKGAAAFYIVAFSTLILVIIATSFAMVIMSEMTRTMNDDLSQSAYDSALAGVEDAKVAFSNYQRCVEAGKNDGQCGRIRNIMANPSCDMVAKILYGDDAPDEIELGTITKSDGNTENVTNQAYTCVKILTELVDYRASLGSKTGKFVETIRAGVADGGTNTVNKIKLSWYLVKEKGMNPVAWTNVSGFPAVGDSIAVPPTLEVQIVQTAEDFSLSQFDEAVVSGGNSQTNRATLYLVPNEGSEGASTTEIPEEAVAKTNDHHVLNTPFQISCNGTFKGEEFVCSVIIDLPDAIGGTVTDAEGNVTARRANDTFLISVSIPYRDPDTDFALELICDDGSDCDVETTGEIDGKTESSGKKMFKNTQIAIESTGRANDLVRRVETRLQTKDSSFGMGEQSPYYALEILGSGSVKKNMTVTDEHNFKF